MLKTIRDENQSHSQKKLEGKNVKLEEEKSSGCQKKKLSKSKLDKIKKIYGSIINNIKSKKNCDENQLHCKTYA